MLRYLLIAFLISLVYMDCRAQTNTAVEQHGSLKVSDGKILNQHNKAPQLRGISLSWSIWGGRKYYNREVISWLTSDFKINLLRVSMAVEPDSGYLKDPEGQTALVIKVVDAAIEKGLYVIIDWHDHHAHLNVERAKIFFAKMAERYSGRPNVIYEVYNEPEQIDWLVVKDYSIKIINEIRKYDAKNIIVVGSPSWDQDVDVAAKDPISGFINIAYSFHFYASEPSHQERLMEKAEAAIKAGLPLFVTEWGVGEADGNGKFDLEKTEKWLAWMEKNQLSWANWNITDKEETTALLRPKASVKGKWGAKQLTSAGFYIRNKLRELNQ